MTDRVLDALHSDRRRAIVWLGAHHMFTRYSLPDLPERPGRTATRMSDRAGNQVWRALADGAFSVLLHYPWTCADGERWGRCLPVEAAIDCLAVRRGDPLGFDLASSPIGELPVSSRYWYGLGYPRVRLLDLADGYVWTRPIDSYESVSLIPLAEFAPDDQTLAEVIANNPVTDTPAKDRAQLQALWTARAAAMAEIQTDRGWTTLGSWRSGCKSLQ
jgi:hypothetical protein